MPKRKRDEGDETDEDEIEEIDGMLAPVEVAYDEVHFTPWTVLDVEEDFVNHQFHKGQSWKRRRHMTDKSGGLKGSGKQVPPLHKDWNTTKFKLNMPFVKFLRTITKKPYIEIIRNEINIESGAITAPRDSPFFQKQIQWAGWSGMLQLELTYPSVMENCQGFFQCLEMMWNVLNEYASSDDMNILKLLNTLVHHTWKDVGILHPVTVRTIIRDRFQTPFKNSTAFRHSKYPNTTAGKIEFVKHGPLQVPDAVEEALKSGEKKRLVKHLKDPDILHEHEIIEGVQRLVRDIWGPTMDTSLPVDFDDEKNFSTPIKAACCLLELMCGSRLLGILLVNWFSALTEGTMQEWLKERGSKTNPYGAWQRCIIVKRLTKEGTKASRAHKQKTNLSEIRDRIIVKPLNTMFVDPRFLSPHKTIDTTKSGTEIFLHLVTQVRKAVFRFQKEELDFVKKDGMYGLVDAQVTLLPKRARTWVNNIIKGIIIYARTRMSFIKPNQGTHLFRKIYVNWAYHAYAGDTMKETGFASEVLGHRGFQVSLNYTSLIIKPSISGEVNDMKSVRNELVQLTKRVKALEEHKPDPLGNTKEDFTMLMDKHRDFVEVEKLPRAQRDTSFPHHVSRVRAAIARLKEKNISVTQTNLYKLGVYTKGDFRGEINRLMLEI